MQVNRNYWCGTTKTSECAVFIDYVWDSRCTIIYPASSWSLNLITSLKWRPGRPAARITRRNFSSNPTQQVAFSMKYKLHHYEPVMPPSGPTFSLYHRLAFVICGDSEKHVDMAFMVLIEEILTNSSSIYNLSFLMLSESSLTDVCSSRMVLSAISSLSWACWSSLKWALSHLTSFNCSSVGFVKRPTSGMMMSLVLENRIGRSWSCG